MSQLIPTAHAQKLTRNEPVRHVRRRCSLDECAPVLVKAGRDGVSDVPYECEFKVSRSGYSVPCAGR